MKKFKTKKQLMQLGSLLCLIPNRGEAWYRACDVIAHSQEIDLDSAVSCASLSRVWAENAFATLAPAHKLAASLMATTVSPEVVTEAKMPWPCFSIIVPAGLLRFSNGDLEPELLLVYEMADGHIVIFLFDKVTLEQISWRADSCADLGNTDLVSSYKKLIRETPELAECTVPSEVEDRPENRATQLISRLVYGLIVELDQPKYRDQILLGPRRPKNPSRGSDLPKCWTFQVTRDVQVDCRPWVTTFLSGEEGKRPELQTLVRGHHKRQVYGPERKLRKWIHIEPYWRGPDDAPIAVRDLKIGDEG